VPGSQELLVIALVALFVLGPERLPAIARSAARGLAKLRNYGVTASKELRGVADLGDIEREVSELRRELARTRADLRRAMRETIASSSERPPDGRPTTQRPAGAAMPALPDALPVDPEGAVEAGHVPGGDGDGDGDGGGGGDGADDGDVPPVGA